MWSCIVECVMLNIKNRGNFINKILWILEIRKMYISKLNLGVEVFAKFSLSCGKVIYSRLAIGASNIPTLFFLYVIFVSFISVH